jgi:aquaporin Z
MKKYIVELIGTFFLTLVVAMTGNPLAIGGVLAAMVYMGGAVSGGHYNPAVSLAALIRGKLPFKDFLLYSIIQVLGASLAGLVYLGITNSVFTARQPFGTGLIPALVVEVIFTFALAFVVLNVATRSDVQGNQYFGLAIGAILAVGVAAGGAISGAVYNPAIAIGTNLTGLLRSTPNVVSLLSYVGSELLGAALAALIFMILFKEKSESVQDLPTRSPVKGLTQIISRSLVKRPADM